MTNKHMARLVVAWCLLFLPVGASAQAVNATIAGVVRDASGGVMPGVSVEAASPVLIDKVRSVLTDGQGLYRIFDLRPGIYTVTFTLPGFNTFRREGLELTTGFTATVNAELNVGALEESVTVTGETPVVDIQNIREQMTIRRDTLDALPTTRRLAHLATLIPAATTGGAAFHDVGGVGSDRGQIATHGQRPDDMSWNVGGVDSRVFTGGNFMFNVHTFQELVVETLAGSAETSTGGVQINVVPKEGGNTFSGTLSSEYTGPSLQGDNIDDALRARGLSIGPASSSVRKYYDAGGGIGGPIKQNTLWFFAAHRWIMKSQFQQGNYWNKRQGTLFYEPDLSRPAYTEESYKDTTLRLTWQAAARHKITFAHSQQPACQCFFNLLESATGGGRLAAPEATGEHHYNPAYMPMVTWTHPATNRFLVEASASANGYFRNTKRQPGVDGDIIAVTDLGKNLMYGSRALNLSSGGGYGSLARVVVHQRAAVSYVTGSHTLKTGFDANQYSDGRKKYEDPNQINRAMSYTFRNEVPVSVTLWATPFGTYNTARDFAVYLQDQWTIRRLTLNMGLRYIDYKATVPAYHLDAGPWVPARDFPAVDNVPHWQDLSPRLGVAYDVFGGGKTALKATLGRYPPRSNPAAINIPAMNAAPSATRTWNDTTYAVGDPRRGNYVPDCVLGPSVPEANGECGAVSDVNFGRPRASSTRRADDALTGFNRQTYNWQSSVSVQHELRPNLGLSAGYFRTWYRGFLATDNQFVTLADFDPFCITAPVDSRLPNSGQQVCGFYDLRPALFGQVDNMVTQAEHYGNRTEVFDGVDVALNARFGQGGQFSGGLSTGRTVTDMCDVVATLPEALLGAVTANVLSPTQHCTITPPWGAATQMKFSVVYPLPWGLQTSAIYQNLPGAALRATYVATNAEIRPLLGRDLGSCRGAATCNGTVTVDLIPPSTLYEDRIQQLDLRLSRTFRLGGNASVRGNLDLYNVFNANTVLNVNTGYGAQWLQPIQVMGGRLIKFGAQLNF